jgi:Bacterial membrane protein YfhO
MLSRARSALGRRPTLSVALLYLLLSLLLVGPALLPGKTLSNSDITWFQPPFAGVKPEEPRSASNIELGDAPGQLQPFLRYGTERMPDIPLWNPHIVAGRPFLANQQSALFSVYTLPAYVLPFWTALTVIGVLKLWVAAFGMFLLGRALGMRIGGALTAGVVYAFSLWMVTWISYPHMSVWSWIPWMLLLTEHLVRRPGLLPAGGLSAVVAVQFLGGHPESSFHALVATCAFFLLRLLLARRWAGATRGRLVRTALAFAGCLLGGAALAALTLVPFAELLLNSADLRDRMGDAIDKRPLERAFALGIFLPDYWGRPTGNPLRLFLLDRALFVGALPLMLAAAALVLRPTLERVCVALFGALWLAVLFGIPPFLQIVTRVPGFSSGHNSRLTVLFVLAAALLAGWGLDELTGRDWPARRRKLVLAVAALLAAVPAVVVVAGRRTAWDAVGGAIEVAWAFATPPSSPIGGGPCVEPCVQAADVIRLAALLGWLPFAVAGVALIALRFRGRVGPAAFVALAALLVCADLFRVGMGYNPAIDRDVAEQPATPAIRMLERGGHARFVSIEPVPQTTIPLGHRLYEARGYDLPIMLRFDRFWRREVSPEAGSVAEGLLSIPLAIREVNPRALRALRLLGVTDILQPLTAPRLSLDGVRLSYDGPDARLYSVAGSLPRAYVATAQQPVEDGDAALEAVTRPGFGVRSPAVTEERFAGLPAREGEAAPGPAEIAVYEPERVVVRARSPGPGMVVLTDNHFPGWKATVDGRPADVERVNYLFRGVRVGPGAHTVEFSYEPLSWTVGWIVSLVALVGLALMLAIGVRRASRPAAPGVG